MTFNLLRPLLTVLVVVMLAACSQDHKISAKDQATYENSVQYIISTLEPERQRAFENALKAVLFADITNLNDLMTQDEDVMRAKFYERIDGKTPDQVIELAVKLRGQKTAPPQ